MKRVRDLGGNIVSLSCRLSEVANIFRCIMRVERKGEKSEKEKNAYVGSSDFIPLYRMPVCLEEIDGSRPEEQRNLISVMKATC